MTLNEITILDEVVNKHVHLFILMERFIRYIIYVE